MYMWNCLISCHGVCADVGKATKKLDLARDKIKKMEKPCEIQVSTYIRDMPFVFLSIGDDPGPQSDRGYVERNTIALLSNWNREAIDPLAGPQ